ncbi:MAG: hypothetical protein HY393_00090 [Candidatus Diapherotrites archaeon]|nr:hypothetical protein [Candidatus Diapherotrites archaeon]
MHALEALMAFLLLMSALSFLISTQTHALENAKKSTHTFSIETNKHVCILSIKGVQANEGIAWNACPLSLVQWNALNETAFLAVDANHYT